MKLRSAVPVLEWPAIPSASAAAQLALLYQLEQTQWWPAEALEQAQLSQLGMVLAFAAATVPYYRELFARVGFDPRAPLDRARWKSLPILSRTDLQDSFEALRSRRVPRSHGAQYVTQTSGSTGQPVKIAGTGLNRLFWKVLTVRDHLWHGRDLGAKLCAIRPSPGGRAGPPDGQQGPGWGPATDDLFHTGPMGLLALGTDVGAQADWLRRQQPEYLLSFPSNLLALAEHFRRGGAPLERLREIRTIGETVTPALRQALREAWDVPVSDVFSSQEVGYIAIECPSRSGLYHLQSESLYVEILDDAGRACAPGEVGRVVVSTLHNFAMPLVRYDLRDYAEAGGPCPCGRGLPTVARVLGRKRNMLVMPNGEKRWPLVGYFEYRDIAPIRQYQLVQRERELIEVRFAVERRVTPQEEARLAEVIRRWLGHPFQLEFVYLDEFPKRPGGKFEDFVSEVAQ